MRETKKVVNHILLDGISSISFNLRIDMHFLVYFFSSFCFLSVWSVLFWFISVLITLHAYFCKYIECYIPDLLNGLNASYRRTCNRCLIYIFFPIGSNLHGFDSKFESEANNISNLGAAFSRLRHPTTYSVFSIYN